MSCRTHDTCMVSLPCGLSCDCLDVLTMEDSDIQRKWLRPMDMLKCLRHFNFVLVCQQCNRYLDICGPPDGICGRTVQYAQTSSCYVNTVSIVLTTGRASKPEAQFNTTILWHILRQHLITNSQNKAYLSHYSNHIGHQFGSDTAPKDSSRSFNIHIRDVSNACAVPLQVNWKTKHY